MRRLKLIVVILAALTIASGGTALAGGYKAKPFSFDPDGVGCGTGAWVAQVGLPDAGRSNHGLVLTKDCPTSTVASGGAVLEGFEGETLTSLGFDYRNDGHCGAGAPRFNVTTSSGTLFFGCAAGAATDLGNGWTHVDMAVPAGVTIERIIIVFDEGTDQGAGFVVLDNIEVNGVVIGKPGNAR
ncbi:MAG: hypothetical protein ACRDJW_01670 [Thermomicrobiales bacterium]